MTADQVSYLDTSKHSDITVDNSNKFDMKIIMDLKQDIRQKLEEIEEQYATKRTVNEGVDKLGEEIAYDINQIESQLKD